jgi:HEXXH motif-containing protein
MSSGTCENSGWRGRAAWSAATLLRALSHPYAGRADDVAEAIATRDARSMLGRFLDRHAQRIRWRSDGLVEALETASTALTLRSAWDPWAGAMARSLAGDDPRPVLTAVIAGLHLTAAGAVSQAWTCLLAEPSRLRFGGCVLPPVEAVSVSVEGPRPRVMAGGPQGAHEATLSTGGVWRSGDGERLPTVGAAPRLTLLVRAEPGIGFPPDAVGPGVASPSDGLPSGAAASVKAALTLLAATAPDYHLWVGWTLRDLVVVGASPGGTDRVTAASITSGRSSDWPGLACVPAPLEPAVLAELLVHEATRQCLLLAGRVGPMDDGSDRSVYRSPLWGGQRTLGQLVAAYHGFGNAVLLHRAMAGLPGGDHSERRLPELLPALRAAEARLHDNPALTPVGRALRDPLMERLADVETAGG